VSLGVTLRLRARPARDNSSELIFTMTAFLRFFAATVCGLAATLVIAAEPPIIAKARGYIASESALNNLKSVHFTGTVVTAAPGDPTKQAKTALEIMFQKPEQQRIVVTSDKTIEVTALDGYDGWQRVQEVADKAKWRQTLLGPEQIKRLRANTWQNVAFFRGIEKTGGRLEDQGATTVDGVSCQKIAFIHAPNIIFYRYFDVATGRLVLTETEAGGTIREQDEVVVNGIRFPRTLINVTKNAKGEEQKVTITFDKITVNEAIPAAQFAVPSMARP
jgi:outer membrane lipoprotein-sorting protein